MNKEILIVVGVIMILAVIVFVLYKYKKEYLRVLAYYSVIQAEELYKSKQGQEKLLFAVNKVKSKLPWYLSWLVSLDLIKKTIEDVLATLQSTFKSSKDKQLAVINNFKRYGVTETRINKLTNEINTNGYVEGYLEGRTDLRGNNNVVAGVRAGKKF